MLHQLFFVLFFFFFFSFPALAKQDRDNSFSGSFRSRILEQINHLRDQIDDDLDVGQTAKTDIKINQVIITQKSEARATGTVIRQATQVTNRRQQAQKIADKIITKLTARHDYLVAAKNRIQASITKKTTEGKNVTEAQTKLNEFTALEASYTSSLTSLNTAIGQISSSDQPLKLIANIRHLSNTVNQNLKLMRQNLISTIRLIVKS
ncbi:MAG: hypothetical protein WC686_03475 [Candidatus Shapirobacteria bacterium]|jgi:hypothetical protein